MVEFIGIGETDIPAIVGVLLNLPYGSGDEGRGEGIGQFQENVQLNLMNLAVDLCRDLAKIQKMKVALLMEEISATDALTGLLRNWVECEGKQATLNKLIAILALNGFIDFAGPLRRAVGKPRQLPKVVNVGVAPTDNGESGNLSQLGSNPLPSSSGGIVTSRQTINVEATESEAERNQNVIDIKPPEPDSLPSTHGIVVDGGNPSSSNLFLFAGPEDFTGAGVNLQVARPMDYDDDSTIEVTSSEVSLPQMNDNEEVEVVEMFNCPVCMDRRYQFTEHQLVKHVWANHPERKTLECDNYTFSFAK